MSQPSNISRKFWDKEAEKYSKKPVEDEEAYQKKLKKTQEYFRPDMQVVELGCGTGSIAIAHAPYVGHIHSIDISPKMVEIAQAKADAAGISNIKFEASTIDDLKVPDESVDAVLAHSVLHLLDKRPAVVAQVHRMLKPGGLFVSTTVCLAENMKFLKYIAPVGRFFGAFPYFEVFSQKEWEEEVTKAGFNIDYKWLPATSQYIAPFIIAKKPEQGQ